MTVPPAGAKTPRTRGSAPALARITVGMGDHERADAESRVALERGRAIGDLQVLYAALAA